MATFVRRGTGKMSEPIQSYLYSIFLFLKHSNTWGCLEKPAPLHPLGKPFIFLRIQMYFRGH